MSHVFRPKHDRHGRGARGPRFLPGTPAWRTRREQFDDAVAVLIAEFTTRWPAVSTIEFATEDVPPSNPASWEDHTVVLARVFPGDRKRGLRDRIAVYRLPIMARTAEGDYEPLLRRILIDRIATLIVLPPDSIDEALGR